MRTSLVIAVVIAVGVGVWVLSGQLDPDASAPEIQKPSAIIAHLDELPSVRIRDVTAVPHERMIELRGSTEPRRAVDLKSETSGTVVEIYVPESTLVQLDDPLLRLDEAERGAQLRQAKALLRQRQIEYEASRKLATKGYRSETERAAAAAALEAAQAAVEAAEIEFSHVLVQAPFAGFLERHLMEVGDYTDSGEALARLVEMNPLRIVAYADEKQILDLSLGMQGQARLSDGRMLFGQMAFVAQEAEPTTRTFRIELEVPNRDFSVPAGIAADIVVPLSSTPAHKVSPALLSLDDAGRLGVKILDQNNRVRFVPVQILDAEQDGIWLTGLPYKTRVITVGQEFVGDGEEVRPIVERDAADTAQPDQEAS
ncbi:MAG: efflux RND transporter periplasmic adaptor subunit [Rhodospirillales bacterium]|nr:efflux RND transporter periplasmic adaptor subunit [Rhodospirillales bacterium]